MAKVNVEFGASLEDLKQGVDEVNSSLDSIKAHIDSVADGFRTLAEVAGVSLSFAGLEAEFSSLAAFANQMSDAQARLGGSMESITTLNGVAAMAGVSFQSLERSVEAASLNIMKGTRDAFTPAAAGLKALGLSAQDLVGLPADEWLARVADRLSQYNSSLTLTSNVQQAFGRGIAEILPLLMEGGDHFREVSEAVKKAQDGLAAAIPGITETQEKLTLLSLGSRAFAAQVFSTLKPAIDGAIDWFMQLSQSITSDKIRDGAHEIGNVLIDITESVAMFVLNAAASFERVGGAIEGIARRIYYSYQMWQAGSAEAKAKIEEDWGQQILKDGAEQERAITAIKTAMESVGTAAEALRARFNAAIPTSGSWAAVGQDMVRLHTETLAAAEAFTKLNAVSADNGARQRLAAQATELEAEIQAEKAKYSRVKAIFDEEAAAFRITQNQKAVYTETALEQEYQAEMATIAKKIALYAQGTKEYEDAEKEKAKLTEQYENQMLAVVDDSQKQMATSLTSGLQTVIGAFNSQLRGLLAGTTSWATAMKNIAGDLFIKLIEMVEQWAVKQAGALLTAAVQSKTNAAQDVLTNATAEAAKTEAVVAGAAARAGAEATGSTAGIASQIANAVTSVGIDAGKVFAGVFGFLAPTMGPAAAGPAAASEAETLAAGLAPLAVGAWEIPGTMPALLHPGEMVLPQTFASGLRSAVGGEGGSGGGGSSGAGGGISLNFSNFIGNQQFINSIMPQLSRALGNYQQLNPSLTS